MKFRIHPPIPNPINLQLKPQPRTIDNHLEREIQVIKLDAPRGRQPRKKAPRHGAQVGRERADVDEVARVGLGRLVGLTRNQVVGDEQGLTRAEVARVVEGDGLEGGEGFALVFGGGG